MKDALKQLVEGLEGKAVTWIQSKADKEAIEAVIVEWHQTRNAIPAAARDRLDELAATLKQEIHKRHPMKAPTLGALREFKQLWFDVDLSMRAATSPFVGSSVAHELQQVRDRLSDPLEKEYFEEAAAAQARGLNRAFVVLFWNIVISRLYNLAQARGLERVETSLNEARKTKIELKGVADLYDVSDKAFIDALKGLGWVDKHQHEVLDVERKRRNRCAHVSLTYKPDDATVLHILRELGNTVLEKL